LRIVQAEPGETGLADIRLIRLGYRAHRALGDIAPLADSIRDTGLRHRIVISPGYGLITGRRRLAACQHLGLKAIAYRTAGTIPQALPLIAEEDADPRQSLPMTVAEAIYRDWAMRDLEWWPRAGSGQGDPDARQDRRAQLSAAAGLNGMQYTRAYEIILAAEGFARRMNRLHPLEDETRVAAAREAVKLLETGAPRDIDRAYGQYRAMLPGAGAPQPPASAAEIDMALARLTGMVAAIGGLALPPDAGPEMLRRWDDVLTMRAIRPLMQFRMKKIRKGNS
jgi:hypothetical protein